MTHVFDAKKMAKLDDPRRKDLIPLDKFFTLLNLQPGEHALDLGCGIGYLALPAANTLGSSGFIFALDMQEAMLAEGLNRSRQQQLANIAWVLTAPDKISLPDKIVDTVMMSLVAHEVPNLNEMLNECYRVLKDGGKIGIVEWNTAFREMGPPVEHRLEPQSLLGASEQAGFTAGEIIELSPAAYMLKSHKG